MSFIRFATARDVFLAFPAAEQDIAADPSDTPALAYLDELVGKGQLRDAVAYCAYLLPRREAVRWACLCIRHTNALGTPQDEAALEAAETWVKEPGDHVRVAALDAANKAGSESPARWAALGAAWSGGNFFGNEDRVAQPPRAATAKCVTAAVLYAGGWDSKSAQEQNLRKFIEICRRLVNEPGK